MHQHPWLILFGVFMALQIPLGVLAGSILAAGDNEDSS
jgi:hypothetical protein